MLTAEEGFDVVGEADDAMKPLRRPLSCSRTFFFSTWPCRGCRSRSHARHHEGLAFGKDSAPDFDDHDATDLEALHIGAVALF